MHPPIIVARATRPELSLTASAQVRDPEPPRSALQHAAARRERPEDRVPARTNGPDGDARLRDQGPRSAHIWWGLLKAVAVGADR